MSLKPINVGQQPISQNTQEKLHKGNGGKKP